MYERMLNKKEKPTIEEMEKYCGECENLLSGLNEWLTITYNTESKQVFPYGNSYGWGIGHYKNKKLMCNIFAEQGAFTVMMRLSNKQYNAVYVQVSKYTQEFIDNRYPCGDGGWIQYRVTNKEQLEDIQVLLGVKCKG